MVSITVDHLGLVYKVRRRLSLALRERPTPAAAGSVGGSLGVGRIIALDDVTFSLEAGDRLGLVGANGSGKTTLLKVLYGIFEPSSGKVELKGRVDALFNISLGFRREATGRRNIVLRGLINGWSEKDIVKRMDAIVAFSELGEFIDMPFKTYSQGMAARLAFAVATSLEPEILLMDEWIGAGDASFRDRAKERMDEIAKKAGIIVLASHNHGLLKRTCNKILELEKGRIKQFVAADEWFAAQEKQ